MQNELLYVLLFLGGLVLLIQLILLFRGRSSLQVESFEHGLDQIKKRVGEEISQNRIESQQMLLQSNKSMVESSATLFDAQRKALNDFESKLDKLTRSNEQKLDTIRETVELKIRSLQEDNAKQLDKMRETVDEKLQGTLDKKLGESFTKVSEQLLSVHKGLAEMQKLASDVGSLQKVLTNVKERGTWGEYQLENILSDLLTPDQYVKNYKMPLAREVVEFAVKLPGKDPNGEHVLIPIDAKFPKEDYERLIQYSELGDSNGVKTSIKALLNAIEKAAKDICEKYVMPPHTTDFGILFLPTEGLYAEVLREVGFHDMIRSKYHILIAGPTTLSALLNSLSVGFRTLAIEKRSHEVWKILGVVKQEFVKYNDILNKLKKQLELASKTVEQTHTRTRVMQRSLREFEERSEPETQALIDFPATSDFDENEDES